MIPIALVVYKIINRNVVSVVLQKPVNVWHAKKNLEEMFEESYRLKRHHSGGESIFYETRRFLSTSYFGNCCDSVYQSS